MVKIGENRGEKTKTQPFSHNTSCCAKFSHDTSLVRKCFCANFQKMHALGPFQKSLVRISQECEPCANLVRIRFWDKFSKPCSLSWYSTGTRNFHTTQGVVRNLHFLFKGRVLLFQCSISSSFLSTPLFRSPNPFLKPFFFINPHSQHHHGSPSP